MSMSRTDTTQVRNVLWIMADQLRWDYLSCYGHPTLQTPHIDGLAAKRRALQSRLCAVADLRRLPHELLHRPLLPVAWRHLERNPVARRRADARRSFAAARGSAGHRRKDAHDPGSRRHGMAGDRSAFLDRRHDRRMRLRALRARRRAASLRAVRSQSALRHLSARAAASTAAIRGRTGPIPPRATTANCCPAGCCATAILRRAVPNEHAETPYITSRAMDFIAEAGDKPWLCHLSYHQAALALHRVGALSRHVQRA